MWWFQLLFRSSGSAYTSFRFIFSEKMKNRNFFFQVFLVRYIGNVAIYIFNIVSHFENWPLDFVYSVIFSYLFDTGKLPTLQDVLDSKHPLEELVQCTLVQFTYFFIQTLSSVVFYCLERLFLDFKEIIRLE